MTLCVSNVFHIQFHLMGTHKIPVSLKKGAISKFLLKVCIFTSKFPKKGYFLYSWTNMRYFVTVALPVANFIIPQSMLCDIWAG